MKLRQLVIVVALLWPVLSVAQTSGVQVDSYYIANADFEAKAHITGEAITVTRGSRFWVVDLSQDEAIIDIRISNDSNQFDKLYVVDLTEIDLRIYSRPWDRLAHGALVVPFKLSLHDHTLSTQSVSLGYYVQYRLEGNSGVRHGPVLSVGLSSITRSEAANNELGATVALGWVWSLKNQFQLGVIAGVDHLGDDSWEYEDKPWVSMMIGFNFLQQ